LEKTAVVVLRNVREDARLVISPTNMSLPTNLSPHEKRDVEIQPIVLSGDKAASELELEPVFVERPGDQIRYNTLSWQVSVFPIQFFCILTGFPQFVSLLMIAEIVSNGMLSLPSALGVVGEGYVFKDPDLDLCWNQGSSQP
jgi:hypothetical protein